MSLDIGLHRSIMKFHRMIEGHKLSKNSRRLYESKRIVLRYEAAAKKQFEKLLRKNLRIPVTIFNL